MLNHYFLTCRLCLASSLELQVHSTLYMSHSRLTADIATHPQSSLLILHIKPDSTPYPFPSEALPSSCPGWRHPSRTLVSIIIHSVSCLPDTLYRTGSRTALNSVASLPHTVHTIASVTYSSTRGS